MPLDSRSLPAILRSQLMAGRVVPFLGAGVGRRCGLPDWPGLLRAIVSWSAAPGVSLTEPPLIEKAISEQLLDRAAHALETDLGTKLFDALRAILAPPHLKPSPLHNLLAAVAWPVVLTTNLDTLLPECFTDQLEVLTWQDSSRLGDMLRAGVPHLTLVHGSIQQPESIVLTPRSYRDSFRSAAQRLYLSTLLAHYSFLFLGCSLNDPDVRGFLEELQHAFGRKRQANPS